MAIAPARVRVRACPPGDRRRSAANVDVLAEFIRRVGDPPVVLVRNSMGGMIDILLTARMPHLVRRLALLIWHFPAPARILRSPTTAMTLAVYALPGVRRTAATRLPVLLVHGDRAPLVPIAAARATAGSSRPGATSSWTAWVTCPSCRCPTRWQSAFSSGSTGRPDRDPASRTVSRACGPHLRAVGPCP